MSAPEALAARLDGLLATAQAEQRLPSVVAGVFRDGEIVWQRREALFATYPLTRHPSTFGEADRT